MKEAIKQIADLVERFERNIEAYHSPAYNETQLRREFIDPFFEALGWEKDRPHGLKYSFSYIVNDERVIGYDNYEHKMDHRHYRNEEYPYKFEGLEKLWRDFINDIEHFREGNP
jgi:hypothetical protein